MAKESRYIIAVDFDGTCVEHNYPAVGMDVEGAVDVLKALNKRGHRIILNTARERSLRRQRGGFVTARLSSGQ